MHKKLTALITSSGRRVELIRCFRNDAALLDIDLKVIAVDKAPELSAACQEADYALKVPPYDDPGFVEELKCICTEHEVALVIPTIDPELFPLACCREDFAKNGTRLLVSSPEVIKLSQNKLQTAEIFNANVITAPRTAAFKEFIANPGDWRLPLILKHKDGSASIGVIRAYKEEDWQRLPMLENYITQELWEGKEYTINIFFDLNGNFKCAVPHERVEVRAGEVSKGITRRMPDLELASSKLAKVIPGVIGPICVQAIVKESGEYAMFDFNARFGGGYPLAHAAGATFSKWILEEVTGRQSSAHNNWQAEILLLRYDAAFLSRSAKPHCD